MIRTVALSLAALHVTISLSSSCPSIKDSETCKGSSGCKWQKKLAVCFDKAEGPPADSPEPTLPPTLPPTDAPTAEPTEPPTDSPTAEPTDAPTEPVVTPTSPPVEGPVVCSAISAKSSCNSTPTCLYQNLNQACVGCPAIESKNSCSGVTGCMWRQKECRYDDSPAHPDDDRCAVNQTKRVCRNMTGCEWNRNGKCKGHQGCSSQKNSIECRGAHECHWMPNKKVCVDLSDVEEPEN